MSSNVLKTVLEAECSAFKLDCFKNKCNAELKKNQSLTDDVCYFPDSVYELWTLSSIEEQVSHDKILQLPFMNRCLTAMKNHVKSRAPYMHEVEKFRPQIAPDDDKVVSKFDSKMNINKFASDYEFDDSSVGVLCPMRSVDSNYLMNALFVQMALFEVDKTTRDSEYYDGEYNAWMHVQPEGLNHRMTTEDRICTLQKKFARKEIGISESNAESPQACVYECLSENELDEVSKRNDPEQGKEKIRMHCMLENQVYAPIGQYLGARVASLRSVLELYNLLTSDFQSGKLQDGLREKLDGSDEKLESLFKLIDSCADPQKSSADLSKIEYVDEQYGFYLTSQVVVHGIEAIMQVLNEPPFFGLRNIQGWSILFIKLWKKLYGGPVPTDGDDCLFVVPKTFPEMFHRCRIMLQAVSTVRLGFVDGQSRLCSIIRMCQGRSPWERRSPGEGQDRDKMWQEYPDMHAGHFPFTTQTDALEEFPHAPWLQHAATRTKFKYIMPSCDQKSLFSKNLQRALLHISRAAVDSHSTSRGRDLRLVIQEIGQEVMQKNIVQPIPEVLNDFENWLYEYRFGVFKLLQAKEACRDINEVVSKWRNDAQLYVDKLPNETAHLKEVALKNLAKALRKPKEDIKKMEIGKLKEELNSMRGIFGTSHYNPAILREMSALPYSTLQRGLTSKQPLFHMLTSQIIQDKESYEVWLDWVKWNGEPSFKATNAAEIPGDAYKLPIGFQFLSNNHEESMATYHVQFLKESIFGPAQSLAKLVAAHYCNRKPIQKGTDSSIVGENMEAESPDKPKKLHNDSHSMEQIREHLRKKDIEMVFSKNCSIQPLQFRMSYALVEHLLRLYTKFGIRFPVSESLLSNDAENLFALVFKEPELARIRKDRLREAKKEKSPSTPGSTATSSSSKSPTKETSRLEVSPEKLTEENPYVVESDTNLPSFTTKGRNNKVFATNVPHAVGIILYLVREGKLKFEKFKKSSFQKQDGKNVVVRKREDPTFREMFDVKFKHDDFPKAENFTGTLYQVVLLLIFGCHEDTSIKLDNEELHPFQVFANKELADLKLYQDNKQESPLAQMIRHLQIINKFEVEEKKKKISVAMPQSGLNLREKEYFMSSKEGKLHDFSKAKLRQNIHNVSQNAIHSGVALIMASSSPQMIEATKKEELDDKDEEVGLELPENCLFSAQYLKKFPNSFSKNHTMAHNLIKVMCEKSWDFVAKKFPRKFEKGEQNTVKPFKEVHAMIGKKLLSTLNRMDLEEMFRE